MHRQKITKKNSHFYKINTISVYIKFKIGTRRNKINVFIFTTYKDLVKFFRKLKKKNYFFTVFLK